MTSTGGKHGQTADGVTLGVPWHAWCRIVAPVRVRSITPLRARPSLCAGSQGAARLRPYGAAPRDSRPDHRGRTVPSIRDTVRPASPALFSPAQSGPGASTVSTGHWNTP